jgi:phage I-like protein
MSTPISAISGAIALASDGAAPADIQWMPPGRRTITATRKGQPVKIEVEPRPEAVTKLNQVIADAQARNQRAYFDFDHAGGKASAWPLEFYWAGDQPNGGIRARVEWSASGRAAVAGRDYRQFSPTFIRDDAGRVVTAPLNMGGLVNDPAFDDIDPLWSRHGGDRNQNQEQTMTPEQLQKLTDSISALTTKVDAVAAAQAKTDTAIAAIQAKSGGDKPATATDAEKDAFKALSDKIVALDTKLTTQSAVAAKAGAEAHWDAACKAGKVAPQDEKAKTFWVNAITQDPNAATVLAGMPVQPALAGAIIPGGGGQGGSLAGEHQFAVKARKLATDEKIDFTVACARVAAQEPALYSGYRESLTATAAR